MQILAIDEPGADGAANELVVGIDFGTTNSLIAISNDFVPKIIADTPDNELVKSIISADGQQIYVGKTDQDYVRSIKRLLAKTSADIKASKQLQNLSNILDLSTPTPIVKLLDQKMSLIEAAALIFKHLRQIAENQLQQTVNKAVVTVPAYFDDQAKGQVMAAAGLAGWQILRLISEPTAAAYAYGLDKQTTGTYLVYDLGGGTFDVSLLNMEQGVLQVIATAGDNLLGGDDIDFATQQYLTDLLADRKIQPSLAMAKQVKELLSKQLQIKLEEYDLVIQRADFEQAISQYIQRTLDIAKQLVVEAAANQIDGIILVGGSSRIPLISAELTKAFGVPILADLDPDRIVAFGAALQAENLTQKANNSLLIDVVPLSVGIELYGGLTEKIIWRNTPIPCTVSRQFTTQADNQTAIVIHIVQGERELVSDCRSLAKFELQVPPQPAGRAKVNVNFTMDANNILSVTAQDTTTGVTKFIALNPVYGINNQQINDDLTTAFKYMESDHQQKLLLEARNQAKELLHGLEKALDETPNLLNQSQMEQLQKAIQDLQHVVALDNRELILAKMQSLNNAATEFIQQHLDLGATLHLKGRNINDI